MCGSSVHTGSFSLTAPCQSPLSGLKDELHTFPADSILTDIALAEVLLQRLNLDIRPSLSSGVGPDPAAAAAWRKPSKAAQRGVNSQKAAMSVEEFVAMTAPLLEAEKLSEVPS